MFELLSNPMQEFKMIGRSCLSILAVLVPVSTAAAQTAMSPADTAFMTSMQTMQEGMKSAKPTGDPDKDFVAMMIPHHQGAVDMAKVELEYGKDKQLRRLAASIVKAQEREIAMMRDWQAKHAR